MLLTERGASPHLGERVNSQRSPVTRRNKGREKLKIRFTVSKRYVSDWWRKQSGMCSYLLNQLDEHLQQIIEISYSSLPCISLPFGPVLISTEILVNLEMAVGF